MSDAEPTDLFLKFKTIIETESLPLLGPEMRPEARTEGEIRKEMDQFFKPPEVPASIHGSLLSAALLWHDHLDASHTISQNIPSADGSFLHGIMHRREPDYGNAKYWFRRVGDHNAFSAIAKQVTAIAPHDGGDTPFMENEMWDPFEFVDSCENGARFKTDSPEYQFLQKIAEIEFDALMDHICRNP
ncbi:MAG TPA: hypothetical protein EYQ50_28905 [Verrucomicrobiales bacterium]|nr:hypothetical protein [Verrucomicrobiales bacterium]HIL71799.1 hypothetical protein [Verrucomicrobiota bacterium]